MRDLNESLLKTRLGSYAEIRRQRGKGLKTGLKGLDRYLQGLGGFVNIQGETSSCKSALALQIVHYNLRRGTPVLMVDKENGDIRVINRMLCQSQRLYEDKLRTIPESGILSLLENLTSLPLHLHTEQILDKDLLIQRVADCWAMYQKPFILLIDSIQAMDRIADDQRVNLEDWVYLLDRLKVEYAGRLHVIVVSEKNRMSYGSQGIGGSKGSNVLDYKPETVLDIRWNEEDDSFTCKVSKHRDGQRGGSFDLRKSLVEKENNRSFCFLLEEIQ